MKKYAIFFPQFHKVPVNDQAWGSGFTDWALVSSANAFNYWSRRFPKRGAYDLSSHDVVDEIFQSAASSGLNGFGIYHYRFDDGPELQAVEDYLLTANIPEDFGVFFIWANENWTKRWAGKDTEILKSISPAPSREMVRAHVQYLKPFMEAKYYTKYKDRPMFVIYRPEIFHDIESTLKGYRDEFAQIGIDPAIGYCLKSAADVDFSKMFDFCYLFEPRLFFNFRGLRKSKWLHSVYAKILHLFDYSKIESISSLVSKLVGGKKQTFLFSSFLDYFVSARRAQLVSEILCPVQNILTSGWNNAPRYRDLYSEVKVPDPTQFELMLKSTQNDRAISKDLPLLCNAWNEWSEGAAIEPCIYLGDSLLNSYLAKTKKG
ncbi:MAG: glycoside hydrolase family 99-like domain-containing protein [Burkholderiales bacterium]